VEPLDSLDVATARTPAEKLRLSRSLKLLGDFATDDSRRLGEDTSKALAPVGVPWRRRSSSRGQRRELESSVNNPARYLRAGGRP